VSTTWREVDKYVQMMKGPMHVIGYGRKCSNEECPQPQARYHATWVDKLSLPHCTYGLDVLAYIAKQHDREQKQFKEIRKELEQEYQIEICEREVGRLYRKIEALLMGNQVAIQEKLAVTAKTCGYLIMAVDALQPDGGGPKLYILHEILSSELISVALVDQANEKNLSEWLAPYKQWGWAVRGTLSDYEKALVAALKTTWPKADHQLCQMHFVKDLSDPVHDADRELGKTIRDAMGRLPSVPMQKQEVSEEDDTTQTDDSASNEDDISCAQPSVALMQAIDIISGVDVETLDTISPEEWKLLLPGVAETPVNDPDGESASDQVPPLVMWFPRTSTDQNSSETSTPAHPVYLSAVKTKTWVKEMLLSQVPASVRPLIEEKPDLDDIIYWEHAWYRRAIQDTRHLGSRRPFLCGGMRGYDQLKAITAHLAARQAEQALDSYLFKLYTQAQRAVDAARQLADDVRQAKDWTVRVERLLADEPAFNGTQLASDIQRQRMEKLLAECEAQENMGATTQALLHTWRRMLVSWGPDLYHCYDIDGLPRSNLGVEALLGRARRQQRRLLGQADTSPLAVTGQGYLRTMSTSQELFFTIFSKVPAWVYRFALRCMEAVEASVRWPRLLHRDTRGALQRFQAHAEMLRQQAIATNLSSC